MSSRILSLPTGAELRLRNESGLLAVVLVGGGTGPAVPGTWSATSELLVDELAPRYPQLVFAEVRYHVKTWNELPSCMADATAAVEVVAGSARATMVVGFSMGGAVSIGIAGDDNVTGVLGLAPWIPDQLSLAGLQGKRLDVIHGSWDRYLRFVPGVSPANSRSGFERAQRLGVEGSYALIPRGLHGCALRAPSGGLLRLPRWRAWVEGVARELERFQASASAEAATMRLRSR